MLGSRRQRSFRQTGMVNRGIVKVIGNQGLSQRYIIITPISNCNSCVMCRVARELAAQDSPPSDGLLLPPYGPLLPQERPL